MEVALGIIAISIPVAIWLVNRLVFEQGKHSQERILRVLDGYLQMVRTNADGGVSALIKVGAPTLSDKEIRSLTAR